MNHLYNYLQTWSENFDTSHRTVHIFSSVGRVITYKDLYCTCTWTITGHNFFSFLSRRQVSSQVSKKGVFSFESRSQESSRYIILRLFDGLLAKFRSEDPTFPTCVYSSDRLAPFSVSPTESLLSQRRS